MQDGATTPDVSDAAPTDVVAAFDAFLAADEVDETERAFANLLLAAGVSAGLRGSGLPLYGALKAAVAPKLNFRTGKVFACLDAKIASAQGVVAKMGGATAPASSTPFTVLVCGAGPVGLRAAVEAVMLGMEAVVVEKRTAFSRANIITFWDETMADMLALGAKQFRPNLMSTGNPKHIGTREMQLILLKDLLLLGGTVRYGMRITGLVPPGGGSGGGRWQGRFAPYARGAGEGAHEQAAAEKALEFQRLKEYESEFESTGNKGKLIERCEVDPSFVAPADAAASGEGRVAFDVYLIGEGGWSDSTRRLGFTKVVVKANPRIGLVINMEYDRAAPKERAMKSKIYHMLGSDWPLKECRVLAEFLEYLKGESHFLALVVEIENKYADKTSAAVEAARASGTLTAETEAAMEAYASRGGLVELGVCRKRLPRAQLLQPENVDAEALRSMARLIATEVGLPAEARFCEVNPVQLFDFSSLARCEAPLKLLTADGAVADGTQEHAKAAGSVGAGAALVCPIGDALQEPVWTSGLGVNRGFHGGLNAVYAAACARHRGLPEACAEADKAWRRMLAINWPAGIATDYRKGCCVKPGETWTADPTTRL